MFTQTSTSPGQREEADVEAEDEDGDCAGVGAAAAGGPGPMASTGWMPMPLGGQTEHLAENIRPRCPEAGVSFHLWITFQRRVASAASREVGST